MPHAVPPPVAGFPIPGRVPAVGAVAAFVSTLAAQPLAAWLFGSQSVEMGLPQIAAALFAGLAAGGFLWLAAGRVRAWALGVLAVLGRSGAEGEPLAALTGAARTVADELKHERGLARGILGGLPVPFLLVDERERAVATNRECLDMLELPGAPGDYLGQTLAQIFYNDPGRKTAVGKSIETGQIFRNLEVEIKGHKGGVRHVLANVFPLYDTDRACIGGLCLYLDMTALKEKERVILRQNEHIGGAAADADALCRRLREASASLSESIGRTGSGSAEQKSRVNEIGVAMEQMSAAVVDVAKSAGKAAQGADDSRLRALEGERAVGDVIAAIGAVAKHSGTMQTRLDELGAQVAGIGRILEVINDIADQTNLLALNAAIEAARAGDAGRGFAVVADEVRKLAEKTMQATGEVAEATQKVQEGARRAAEGMTASREAVEKSTRLADGAGKTLEAILSISQASADQVRTIAAASEQQSASAEEITGAVEQVRGVSERTAREMSGAAGAVEDLTRMADELAGLIAKMQAC